MVCWEKKGQVTALTILGVVIVAVVLLLFLLRDRLPVPLLGGGTARERMAAVEKHIEDCVRKIGDEPLRRIALQGGHLELATDTYRMYLGTPISYLCTNIAGVPQCANRLLLRLDMEQELNVALGRELERCIDVRKIARGMQVQESGHEVQVAIGTDVVDVTVLKEVTLMRDDDRASQDAFRVSFAYPLGRLYEVVQDILQVETTLGEFEQLSYMLSHKGQYLIEKKKPYPDKLYLLQVRDNDYLFQFFVQGEPS